MPVKVKTVGENKAQFLKWLMEKDKSENKKTKEDITKNAKKHLGKTLLYREQSGRKSFENASVVVDAKETSRAGAGTITKYRIYVSDGGSKREHKIWHIAQFGRQENMFIANKHIRYPLRNMRRTKIGRLDVDPFMGMSGQWRSIGEGDFLPGFKGRNWYQRYISDYLKKYFKGSKFQRIYELSPIEVKGGK